MWCNCMGRGPSIRSESASRRTTTVRAVLRPVSQRLGDVSLPFASAGAISAGLFSRVFGALPCRLLIPGVGGRPINICRDGPVCIAACPLSDAPACRLASATDPGAGSCAFGERNPTADDSASGRIRSRLSDAVHQSRKQQHREARNHSHLSHEKRPDHDVDRQHQSRAITICQPASREYRYFPKL